MYGSEMKFKEFKLMWEQMHSILSESWALIRINVLNMRGANFLKSKA